MALLSLNRNPPPRTLRWFAGLWFPLFLALLGLKVWTKTGSLGPAAAVWVCAAIASATGLAFLPVARLLYVGLIAITFPIGYVLSHVILGVVYYGVLTPIGLVMRAAGADPMKRRIDRRAKSYWIARPGQVPVQRYFRQY